MSIKLYQFPPHDLPVSPSPFCAKLEAYFRLNDIDYTAEVGDVRKSPMGKVPYIEHDDGVVSDSTNIIKWCNDKYGVDLDAHLTDEQRHLGHLIKRTAEEHLYFALLYSRFTDPEGWSYQIPIVHNLLPALLRPFLTGVIRKSQVERIAKQGLGGHPVETVYEFGGHDLDALFGAYGSTPYIFGDKPTTYDCILWSQCLAIVVTKSDNSLKKKARGMTKLMDYVRNFNEAAKLDIKL